MQHSPAFLELVNGARSRIQETDVESARAAVQGGEYFYFIDVREESEWQRAHLPGAIHLGKGILERDIEATVADKTAKIVLYCGGGYRSALAADSLQQMGYTDVWSMDGGFSGWRDAGHPLVEGD